MRLIIITSLLLAACATSQQSSSNNAAKGPQTTANQITPTNSNLSLADYLKRIPGVQVMEGGAGGGSTRITVRGANSFGDNQEPLFVINGVNAGNGYESAASLVDINDIASVQVLKSGQETAPYGLQGTNGVIVIKTKKVNH
jgi:TonB-dependent SusC/RagA subfamily outer membrane receptor